MAVFAINPHETPEPLGLPVLAAMAPRGDLIEELESRLLAIYGPVFKRSRDYLFDEFTTYYQKEFGSGLVKRIYIFSEFRELGRLAADKKHFIALEQDLSREGLRRLNLDPGFLTLSKLILASTKDHAHRIYLKNGIFAEITLSWKGDSFTTHPWSYRDYASQIPFLNQVRNEMRHQLGPRARIEPARYR